MGRRRVCTNVCTGPGGGSVMSFYRHKVKYLGVLERVMEHNDLWSSCVCTHVWEGEWDEFSQAWNMGLSTHSSIMYLYKAVGSGMASIVSLWSYIPLFTAFSFF